MGQGGFKTVQAHAQLISPRAMVAMGTEVVRGGLPALDTAAWQVSDMATCHRRHAALCGAMAWTGADAVHVAPRAVKSHLELDGNKYGMNMGK